VKWSPDEEWLAFSVIDQDPTRSGLWLVNLLNPQQEFFMCTSGSNPVFGPWVEGQKILTYSRFDDEHGESKTWIFDLATGEHQLTPLPSNAQVVA
jgi:Tol biopolymer transport system component